MTFVVENGQDVGPLGVAQCALYRTANLRWLIDLLRVRRLSVLVTKESGSASRTSTARKVDTDKTNKLSSGGIYDFPTLSDAGSPISRQSSCESFFWTSITISALLSLVVRLAFRRSSSVTLILRAAASWMPVLL